VFGGESAFERFGDAGQRQARPQRRHRADDARQAHHRNDRGIAPEFCRNELLHPVNEVRQSRPITYLFTHAVTSN
jgi:hypothetical protein